MYYVIQVITGNEDKAIQEIKERISSVDYDLFSPSFVYQKKYQGKWHEVKKASFPGYIFIKTDHIKEIFKLLYFVPGFTKILGQEGNSDNFLPLNETESRMIDILYNKDNGYEAPISHIEIKEGQKILILDGPLYNQQAMIKKVNLHKRLVTVTLSIFGKGIDVDLGIDIIQTINS